MDSGATAALVAAVVSGIGVIASVFVARHTASAEREKTERELQRRLTERLLDRRLDSYPRAYEITDALYGKRLFDVNLTRDSLRDTLDQLLAWQRSSNALILSDVSRKTFYNIRDALTSFVENVGAIDDEERQALYNAKIEFRRALRGDVHYLYSEEPDRSSSATRKTSDTVYRLSGRYGSSRTLPKRDD